MTVFVGNIYRALRKAFYHNSSHTKLAKQAIALSCLNLALRKSSLHKVKYSFRMQVSHLGSSGFPCSLLVAVGRLLLRKHKMASAATTQEKRKLKKVVVMPYIHTVSPNLKESQT